MNATEVDPMPAPTDGEPQVWVGCLACYNDGRLVGAWVDGIDAGDITPEQLHGRRTSHEELWCFDHQDYAGLLTGECSPFEASKLAKTLDAIEEDERGPFGAWVEYQDGDPTDPERFREQYRGEWNSEEDYARSFAEDIGAIDDEARWPNYCIDWERATRELFMDGLSSVRTLAYTVWIFDANA